MSQGAERQGEIPARALRYRWLIFWVLAVGYLFVYFHRVSSAVVAPELAQTFGISGATLGILASAYFYPYACMQLPVGLLADSLGSRKTVTVFLSIASLGAVLFGLSPNVTVAILARVMVGLGVAALFVSTLKVLAEWFRAREFAGATGIYSWPSEESGGCQPPPFWPCSAPGSAGGWPSSS